MRILVLDAANYNTLAIVRYLGKMKDVELDVVGYNRMSLSFFSRYVSNRIIIANPKISEEKFYNKLLSIIQKNKYDLIMPVGFHTHKICSDNRDEILKYTHIVLPSKQSFEIASSKAATYQLAEKIGISCPNTYSVSSYDEIKSLSVSFPIVVKAPFEIGKAAVAYVSNNAEMYRNALKIKAELDLSDKIIPIIQEYIKGDGYGFFAYYEDGICKQYFMHKRIREYPPSGGISVCAEGFYDDELVKAGKKMLDYLKWNGVAMVEFKKDVKDGIYKLMEINPKFWGSLELALASKVNFPGYIIKRVKNEPIEQQVQYKRIRFHWILNGEIYHFFIKPSSFFKILKDLFVAKSDIHLADPIPNLIQILLIFVHYYKKTKGLFSV